MQGNIAGDFEKWLTERLARGKWIGLGLGNNLDREVQWNSQTVNALLRTYGYDALTHAEALPTQITTPQDFLKIVAHHFEQGRGGEFPILNEAVCRFIEQHFECQSTIGGTAARAGCALAKLGGRVLVHVNTMSAAIRQLLNFPGFYTVLDTDIVAMPDVAVQTDVFAPHYILQYHFNDEIQLNHTTLRCPQSNRLILPYDEINRRLPLNPQYFARIREQADNVAAVVISGFNAMVDETLLLQRIRQVNTYVADLQARKIPVYLEDGAYHIPAYKEHILTQLGRVVDVFGCNEDEFTELVHRHQATVDLTHLPSIIAGLEILIAQYALNNMVLHTKDYALYYGAPMKHDVARGLLAANLLAATRARIGRDGQKEEVYQTLAMPASELGVKLQQQAQQLTLNRYLAVSPAKYIPKPACTVGLGDTFVAGFQLCF